MPPLLSKAFQKKTPKYHGTAILLAQDCTMRTAAHLILPSQLQSQTPAGTHWTRNSRVSLSLNPSAPQSHHRFPAHSCLVKLPRVMQPTDTPGEVLLLQPHTVSFHVPSARAALMGTLGITADPRGDEWLRWTQKVRRCQDGKEAYASTSTQSHCSDLFSAFFAICPNYRAQVSLIQGNRS